MISTNGLTLSEEDLFYQRLGRAVSAWSMVESGLCSWFERLTTMHPLIARKLFYSMTGFDARRRMFLTAVNNTPIEPDISDYLRAIVKKAHDYLNTRNKMVHGDVLYVNVSDSKHFQKTIILQGRQQWFADPPDDEVITSDNLVDIHDHFAALATTIMIGLNWNGLPDESPLRMVELIRGLPNPPHSQKLDQNIGENLSLYQSDLQNLMLRR